MPTVSNRLDDVLGRIQAAADRSGRKRDTVKLVAVSKTKPVELMREYADAATARGIPVIFGENYVQEFKAKAPLISIHSECHLIGPLQSNKVRDAVGLFSLIHSVHSFKVLALIGKEAERVGKQQRVLLQVNISKDPAKQGFLPEELLSMNELGVVGCVPKIEGLMAITALYDSPEGSRGDFKALRELGEKMVTAGVLPVQEWGIELSMGMSSDFEVAIEEGATLVRVGSALFGER